MNDRLFDPELIKLIKYYGTIGLDLAATILGGLALGWIADGMFNTRPVFLLAFFALGCYGGFISVYRLVMRNIKKEELEEKAKKEDED